MLLRYYIFFTTFLFTSPTFSQLNKYLVDSLQQVLTYTELADVEQIDIMNTLGEEFAIHHYDSALMYFNNGIELARKVNHPKGLVNALNQKGAILKDKHQLFIALEVLNEAYAINQPLEDSRKEAAILYNISTVYFVKNDLEKALDLLMKVISIDEQNGDEAGLGYDYFRLAEIYLDLGNFNRTETYLNKSLAIRQKLNDKVNLMHVYNVMGDFYFNQKQYDSSLVYVNQLLWIADSLKAPKKMAIARRRKGELLFVINKYEAAMRNFEASLKIAEKYNIHASKATNLHMIGYTLGLNGHYQKGLAYLEEADLIYDTLDMNAPQRRLAFAKHMVYEKMGDWKQALLSYKRYAEEESKLKLQRFDENVAELEVAYQTAKKERENMELKAQQTITQNQAATRRTINFLLGGLLLLTLFLLFFVYKNYQQKRNFGEQMKVEVQQKTEELANAYQQLKSNHQELKLFYATIAHDFRNPVLLTQSYLEELGTTFGIAETPKLLKSKKALQNLYNSFDTLMKFFRMEDVPLMKKEVKLNRLMRDIQLEMEQLKIAAHLKLEIKDLPIIQADPLLLRQVIYNLILNAAKSTQGNDEPLLEIFATNQENQVQLFFKDNGKGIPVELKPNIFDSFVSDKNLTENNLGIGLFIIKNIVERHQGNIHIINNKNTGVTFQLVFPK